MRKVYQSIWVELPYSVVQILDIKMNSGMNCHANLQIVAICEDEERTKFINQPVEYEIIQAGYVEGEKKPFFIGRVMEASIVYENGQMAIKLIASSMTQGWDIVKRRRTFQNIEYTYAEVISQVLSAYPDSLWISEVDTAVKIPGFLLQYDETDWEFLCRLASHFETYIMEDPAGDSGQIYFGIPSIDQGHQVNSNCYQIFQNMEKYQLYAGNVTPGMALQNNLDWLVFDRVSYNLGETVKWKQVSCQIVSVNMEVKGAEILYSYGLERVEGVKSIFYGNKNISGLSLPATIKERSGNRLRVKFDIDSEYRKGNNYYFTYAIETTSWYCLPEPGSTVHIYFQNWDETSGIAIQAMRKGSGADSVSARGAVSDKSFSTVSGEAMEFTDTGIIFSSVSKAACFIVSKDGSLHMEAEDIFLCAQNEMNIGKGMIKVGEDMQEIIPRNTILQSETGVVGLGIVSCTEEEVTLADDKGIVLDERDNILLVAAGALFYEPTQIDPPSIQYSDAELREEDATQREAHNAEVFEVRENESAGKITVGAIVAGIGLLCLAGVATVATGGAAAVLFVAGTTAYFCGAAQVAEGAQDMSKMSDGDFSQSFNMIRDTVCGGNQETYETIMYGSVMIGIGVLLSPLSKPLSAMGRVFAQMMTAGSLSVMTLNLQDMADGYVDVSWQTYIETFGITSLSAGIGAVVGLGFAALGEGSKLIGKLLSKAGKYAPALIIGAETVIDFGVDYGTSELFDQEFDWKMSLLVSLASNIAFSIDPVNMATGGFCLTATDLLLPDLIDEHFRLQRIYNSVIPCIGGLGRNWMLGIESRLFIREKEGLIDVICMDGHAERFSLEEGTWKNRRQGDARYQLQKTAQEDGEEIYTLLYAPEQKKYNYDKMGRLITVQGKGLNKLVVQYQDAHISRVVTSAGYILDFQYEGNRIIEISDEAGRSIRYKYEDDCLKAVCHVDEGVTTYHYDEKHHITQVIDQNGHAYVDNEYDDDGRVIAQRYLDGTKSVLAYDSKNRENTVYIEGLGRTERYRYNRDYLVTHTYYDDGTWEETEYDQWTNHIYEKDRNGNITRRQYDCQGNLCGEELPSGQVWVYRYNNCGELLSKKADTGEEICYDYDENGFLIEESEKIREREWKQYQYERDAHGRIVSMTDSLGNITIYSYDNSDGHLLKEPSCVEDAIGNRTEYEYDRVGRRNCIKTDMGITEIRYNPQNYPTYVKDRNGGELRRSYDKLGNLTAMFPPNQGADGNCWMYRYDFFDRLIETRDPLGNIWKKERNLAGDILCEKSPDGQEVRYEYDTDSHRLRTIYEDGSVERCFYDGNGNLIKKVRPENYSREKDDGPGITYTYDCMNRLTQVRDEDGQVRSTYAYDMSGHLVERTNGAGYTTYYTYDYLGNRLGMWEPVEQLDDDRGVVLYRATLYDYDSESNKIRERRGLDKVGAHQIPQRTHEIRFGYDALNRLVSVEDLHGAKAAYRYNGLNQKIYESFRISADVNRVIQYEYDALGNLTARKERIEERFLKPNGKERTVWAVTKYEYDANGNCVRLVTPKGYEKQWKYDALDRVVGEKERDKVSGICRSFQYKYDSVGKLLVRRDHSTEQSTERQFQYDGRKRLTHLTDESGATTRLFYDRNGRITKIICPEQYDTEQDDGQGIHYTYDCRDQVVRITGPDGTVIREQTYDRMGNVKERLEGKTLYTEYDYNLAGNLLAVYRGKTNAGKRHAAQRMDYDIWGNITSVEDGNCNRTEFLLDDWGRIIETHTPEGGKELYTYNYAGNITSTTDANGGTITYRYNSMGRVCQITDQEGNNEYFYYDEEGRQETHIDRNGNVERTLYNMDGNLSYQRFEDRKGRNSVVNQYVYYQDGRLKEAAGGGITYHYAYTENGLLKNKSTFGKKLLEYTYDRNRNLSSLADSTGNVIYYSYDMLNRLKRVSGDKEDVLAEYDYTGAGQIRKLRYGNGVETEYSHREDGELSSLVTLTGQGQVLLNFDYAYDGNGNCIKKSGETYQNEYAYDCMNRLSSAVQDGKEERYAYDLAGNRLKKETAQGTEIYYYNVKNQLTCLQRGADTFRYLYDRQGNLLEKQGKGNRKQYNYDVANRQVGVIAKKADGVTEKLQQMNWYDGEGLRYETEENGKIIRFLFDRGELVEESSAEEKISYARGYQPIFQSRNGRERNYFVQDEMGSTLLLLDHNQEIQKTYRYDAFGNILKEMGDIPNRVTYTGQMYDGAAGQYYLRARFYNPAIGRFLQEDTFRRDGLNLYAYCANNPVIYYDPSGHVLCLNGKTASQLDTYEEVQYHKRISATPGEKSALGTWTGQRGESMFIPTDPDIQVLLRQKGLEGITYKDGIPDFSKFAEVEIQLFNMHGGESGRSYNFSHADELAGQGHTLAEISRDRGMNYTWHECNDMITMQLIPSAINDYFGHMGGVGEINLLFELFNPNQTGWYYNWKK